jgi:hypothetical protein
MGIQLFNTNCLRLKYLENLILRFSLLPIYFLLFYRLIKQYTPDNSLFSERICCLFSTIFSYLTKQGGRELLARELVE